MEEKEIKQQAKSSKHNNKFVLIIAIIVLLIVDCIFLISKIKTNNIQNKNNDISSNDEKTINTYEVTYEHNTEVTYMNPNKNGFQQNLKIVEGNIIATNKDNNETYQLKSIADAKYIMLLCEGTDSECQNYVVLTNSGEIYYSNNNLYRITNLKDFDNEFILFEIDLNIVDIGYTEWAVPSAQHSLVVKDTNGNEYLINRFSKNIQKINVTTSTSTEEAIQQKSSNEYAINLSKEKESFDIGKLHLDFDGVTYKTDKGHYNYALNIKYNGKDIDSTFFNDKDNYRIWSHNMAADFKIYKIDNVYILVSFIAKQCFCDEVMIFNTNGDVLKTFSTADFEINGSSINIKTSDNGQCMGQDWETHVKEYDYVVDGFNLIQK